MSRRCWPSSKTKASATWGNTTPFPAANHNFRLPYAADRITVTDEWLNLPGEVKLKQNLVRFMGYVKDKDWQPVPFPFDISGEDFSLTFEEKLAVKLPGAALLKCDIPSVYQAAHYVKAFVTKYPGKELPASRGNIARPAHRMPDGRQYYYTEEEVKAIGQWFAQRRRYKHHDE
jgi:hypothetical protein